MTTYKENFTTAWSEDSIRFISSPSVFAKSTLYYVQEIGHFRTLPGYFTEREQLDSYLIVYTINGKGRLKYQGKSYNLQPQQVFFIHCEDYHYYETDPLEPWEILWVHLHGSATSGYYEQFTSNDEPVLQLNPESIIPAVLRQILHYQQQRSARTELISSKLLVDLLTELLLAAQNISMPDTEKPSYIEDICQMLEHRFIESISLDQLAHEYAVSKYHLAKQFKRYTGYSPHEYLILIRMTHAKERLKYSDMPVSEVAARVGIDNVSHFINLFKDRAGDTPLAYRKKWQRPR